MAIGLYSGDLPNDPEKGINVTQYGWDGEDVSGVTLIQDYIAQAQAILDEIIVIRDNMEAILANSQFIIDAYNYIKASYEDILIKYPEIVDYYNRIVVLHDNCVARASDAAMSATSASNSASEALSHLTAIQVIQLDINTKYADILIKYSEIVTMKDEVTALTEEVRDIAEELRRGQVYRGIWNPNTQAWPDPMGSNSVWDVTLNSGQIEYIWNGIKWLPGDRLIYTLATNTYDQIESATGVFSVNGKTGYVTLIPSDIGAYSTSEVDTSLSGKVDKTTTVNGKALSGDISITASDVGAYSKLESDSNYVPKTLTVNNKPLIGNITLTSADTGSLPLSGGTLTGPLIVSNMKGAIKVHDQKSISYQDQANTVFHNFAQGNNLMWNQGISGENNLLQLGADGTFVSQGPQYAKGSQVVQNSTNNKWLAIECPETGDPYISSKTTGEVTTTPKVYFRNNETYFTNTYLGADVIRVQSDGGLKFSPSRDLNGLTWGMGVNPSTREFALHAYNNGAYNNKFWSIDSTGRTTVNGARFTVAGDTHMTGFATIVGAGNNGLDFHQPGNSSVVVYKPMGSASIKISQSNGSGVDSGNYGTIDSDGFSTGNGRFKATYTAGNRSWTSIGQNGFWLQPMSTGAAGALFGIVGTQMVRPSVWAIENYYGMYNGTDALDSVSHVFGSTDGSGYQRMWFLRNSGDLSSPSGSSLTSTGNITGSVWGSYVSVSEWATASFALKSDARLKTIIGKTDKSALEDVSKINFHRYVWNENAGEVYTERAKKVTEIGVIAQELEDIDPNYIKTVRTFGEELSEVKTLDTANLLALALKAIQELKYEVEVLKAKINN